METQEKKKPGAIAIFEREDVQSKFKEILKGNAPAFITTMLTLITQNDMLKDADPTSVYMSALTSASLGLPINPNLGFAYILPYKNKDGTVAQFQLGYKGFIQLAQRSGQFKTINAVPVYSNDNEDNVRARLTSFLPQKANGDVIGYCGYFKLQNGYEQILSMGVDELQKHGKKYSQTYKRGFGLWETDFEAMAIKTVIKLLLSKYAPLSVDMQRAIIADQGIIEDENLDTITYPDNQAIVNTEINMNSEFLQERVDKINTCMTIFELDQLKEQNKPTNKDILILFSKRYDELQS